MQLLCILSNNISSVVITYPQLELINKFGNLNLYYDCCNNSD